MKIVTKTYLLISILVVVAAINLVLLYQEGSNQNSESHAIIEISDIKVRAESVSGFAISVANGNIEDKENLENEVDEVDFVIKKILNGEDVHGHAIVVPSGVISEQLKNVATSWDNYKSKALNVKETSVFDKEATDAVNYVLQKNQDLVLLTDQLIDELEPLDRNYNKHKKISKELAENARIIGQQTLLISIGEDGDSQEILKEKKLEFEIGLRKLLGIPTWGLDVNSVGEVHEDLEIIPRENASTLRELEPLWESIQIRIQILEERALLSPEFNIAKNEMIDEKLVLFDDVNQLVEKWNEKLVSENNSGEGVVQALLAVNIAVFVIVVIVVRQSMSPLESITRAISKVKEGVYGDKINYSGSDEVGQLVSNFNIMSDTIKEKEEEARKTDIAKDEFLAMITHELKTPLVPIQGYADILLSEHLGKLTAKQKERISIIKNSSETLLSIISDLLDAERNNVQLTSYIKDMNISHDPERIKQVITNLIKNSLTAVAPGSGKIEVTMEDTPTEIKINVKDNGIGIPADKQKDLFKKFYQVDATLTRETGGSGLGLAICKGIIDNHGGQISVTSSANQGATFSLTLPKEESSKQPKSPIGTA
jgi:signal transduction histidine kinase